MFDNGLGSIETVACCGDGSSIPWYRMVLGKVHKMKCPHCNFELIVDPIYDWGSEGKMMRHVLIEHTIRDFVKEWIDNEQARPVNERNRIVFG